MRVPQVEVIDSIALPRPTSDTPYEGGLVSDHYEVRRGYHVMRQKGTPTSYVMYTVSGRGFFRDDADRLMTVGKGDFVLVDPRTYQEYGIWPESQSWNAHWVHFDPRPHWWRWLRLATRTGLSGVSFAHVSRQTLRQNVSDLFFELQLQMQRTHPKAWCPALCLNLLERILILAHSDGDASRPLDPRIRRVLQAIEGSVATPPTATELSAIAGLSLSRLTHLFKEQTGGSMIGALTKARLRAAQRVLRQPDTDLTDAAELVGFRSPYSFSTWFLKQTGLRPGAYRRRWRLKESAASDEAPRLSNRRCAAGRDA